MKKFIYNIFIFSLLILSIVGGFYLYLFNQPKTTITISKKNIIMGDSNTQWSINDSILSSYANYSTGGEMYIFAYRKLSILANQNKIDTLLLSLNPHNIINNTWWEDGGGGPVENRMPVFYRDFSFDEHKDIFVSIPRNYVSAVLNIGTQIIAPLFKLPNSQEKWGGGTTINQSLAHIHQQKSMKHKLNYKYTNTKNL